MSDHPKACERCGKEGTADKLPPGGEPRKPRLFKLAGRWCCLECGDYAIAEWNAIIEQEAPPQVSP
jgi:hypothetical protein